MKRILSVIKRPQTAPKLMVQRPIVKRTDNTVLGDQGEAPAYQDTHHTVENRTGSAPKYKRHMIPNQTPIITRYRNYLAECSWWAAWYGPEKVSPYYLPPIAAESVRSCENGPIDTTTHGTTKSRIIPAAQYTDKQLAKLRNLAALQISGPEYDTYVMEVKNARERLAEYESRDDRKRAASVLTSIRNEMRASREYQRLAVKREMARDSGLYPTGEPRPCEWTVTYTPNPQFRRSDGKPSVDYRVIPAPIPAIPNYAPQSNGPEYLAHSRSNPGTPFRDTPSDTHTPQFAPVPVTVPNLYFPRVPLRYLVPLARA